MKDMIVSLAKEPESKVSGFGKLSYDLEGTALVSPDAAMLEFLAEQLAAIDPWKRLGISRNALNASFRKAMDRKEAWGIEVEGSLVGIVIIKPDWLLGPYLNLIGLLPEAQGKGLGTKILGWMQAEAEKSGARNLFLCVTDFNQQAIKSYQRFGFEKVGELDGLIVNQHSEILMRKRLS